MNLTRNQRVRAYGAYNTYNPMYGDISSSSCYAPIQWSRCNRGCLDKDKHKEITNKLITNTVRVSSSEYIMNKAAAAVTKDLVTNEELPEKKHIPWNQSSDRKFPAKSKLPSYNHKASAQGVDIKHNSYHRYLLKKKGLLHLRSEPKPSSPPLNNKATVNNKYYKDSIGSNTKMCC